MRHLVGVAGMVGALLLPVSPAASLEGSAVYEDWQDGVIDSRWWRGGEGFGGQEIGREVRELAGGFTTLELRYRLQGSTDSNMGSTFAVQHLNPSNPMPITQIFATFRVPNLSMTTCDANNTGAATRARPARLLMTKFNDGTQSVPGNNIGDYLAGVEAFRDGSSTDPPGVLKVRGFVSRCANASCVSTSPVATATLAETVAVGENFTLRLHWDQPNQQFLFGVNFAAGMTPLPYSVDDSMPAANPFINVQVGHSVANCTAGPVEIDSTTWVGQVYTNVSGLVASFTEVSRSHVFFPFIEAIAEAGITAGCSASPPQYCPDAGVTRGQMAVFLLRGIHGPGYLPPPATGIPFTDVPDTHPFAAWIEQLRVEGVTAGCLASPPQYCPEGGVTRGQMAVFLLRAKHGPGFDPPAATGMFTDVATTHQFAKWIEQLAREGITAGCGGTSYCPEAIVTRGQMAVFLVRAFDLPL